MQTLVLNRNREIIPSDWAIHVDHVEDTFTISISSLNGVSENDIKNLLQSKFKVDDITQTKHWIVAR